MNREQDQAASPIRYEIGPVELLIRDRPGSRASEIVASELCQDVYGLSRIQFREGDTVLDIGAHVGMVTILLALLHPGLRIYAYEPYPPNFRLLQENLESNGVRDVVARQCAVTADRRLCSMATNPRNSGAATMYAGSLTEQPCSQIPSVTLDDIFATEGIHSCRLLKIDCEGAEYEILLGAASLSRVSYLSCEIHVNDRLTGAGRHPDELIGWCRSRVRRRCIFTTCRMSQ